MLTLDQIKKRLETSNIRALAKATDVHPNTLYAINNDRSTSYEVVKKLSDYFESVEK